MKKLFSVLFIAMIMIKPDAAKARQWVIFDGPTNTCENAPTPGMPASKSPETFLDTTRASGIISTVQENKLSDGTLVGVTIMSAINDNDITVMFFTSMDFCNKFLAFSQQSGSLPNLSDLK